MQYRIVMSQSNRAAKFVFKMFVAALVSNMTADVLGYFKISSISTMIGCIVSALVAIEIMKAIYDDGVSK